MIHYYGKEIKDTDGIFLTIASQFVDFKLNNKGGKLKSDMLVATDAMGTYPTTTRRFQLTSPFVMFIKEENKEKPYFAVRVIDSTYLDI